LRGIYRHYGKNVLGFRVDKVHYNISIFQIVAFQKLEMNAVSLPAEVNVAHFCFSGVSICFLDVFVDCGN
jgi:hypothetical protein